MPTFDPKAVALLSVSAASGMVQADESILVMAGLPVVSSGRPNKRKVVTILDERQSNHSHQVQRQQQQLEQLDHQHQTNNTESIGVWDVLLNSCVCLGQPIRRNIDCPKREMYRSDPMSPLSPAGSFMDNYYDMLQTHEAEPLRRSGYGHKVVSASSSDSGL